MNNTNKRDVIRLFCEGYEDRFKKVACKYYEHSRCILLGKETEKCKALSCHQLREHYDAKNDAMKYRCLLRKPVMELFLKECRYDNFKLLDDTSKCHSASMIKTYNGVDDLQDVVFVKLTEVLTNVELETPLLSVWIGYVKIIAERAVIKILYGKKECGSCKYFSESSKYCYKKQVRRNKTLKPCEDYVKPFKETVSMDTDEDDDNSLKDTIPSNDPSSETVVSDKDAVFVMKKLLSERIDKEAYKSKRRQICQRQYDLFVNFFHLLSEGVEDKDAKKMLAEKFHIEPKTISCDFSDIRNFLQEKMSENDKTGLLYI